MPASGSAALRWNHRQRHAEPLSAAAFDPADFVPRLQTQLLVLQPTPFCNIQCDYCYLPDRDLKARMNPALVSRAVQALRDDELLGQTLTVAWHAGEPLAVPRGFYGDAFAAASEAAGPGCTVSHAMQTNATLIDDEWCLFFASKGVRVGVSIDGPAFLHDAHRRTRRGHGTHARVLRGIERLRAHAIPFDVIAVVTADTLGHADAFADFFETLGACEVGCNFDEAEGDHRLSSLAGLEGQHQAFLARLFDRADASAGRLVLREQRLANGLIDSPLATVFWRGEVRPINPQALPFAIVNVAHNGDFGTFSPELLGQRSDEFAGFALGNVETCGYLESTGREPFRRLWASVSRGTEACRRDCAYFDFCGGGAPANKLYEHGSLASGETLYCRNMIQRPFELALARAEQRARVHAEA
jgi:uncharacterized protein